VFTAVGSSYANGMPVVLTGSSLPGGFTGGFAGAGGFHLAAVEDAEYEPVMLFINHSCEPNVGFAGNTVLVAMRDISPGEELTTDYALFDDYDDMMQCRCGTPSCRATIGGEDWQRPDLQRKYGNYFSSYLLSYLLHRLARQPDRPG
jgi:SET domain